MVAADSGFASLEDMDDVDRLRRQGHHHRGQRGRRGRPARRCTGRSAPSTDPDLIQAAFVGRPVRRLVVRHEPARPACARPTPTAPTRSRSWPRSSPRSRSPRRCRRRHAVGAGRRLGDPRHDPGRGVRHHPGQRRRDARPPRTPAIRQFLGAEVEGEDGTSRSIPGLGLPVDFAYQVVKPGRELRRDLRAPPHAARPRARRQRALDRRRPALRPAVPLSGRRPHRAS